MEPKNKPITQKDVCSRPNFHLRAGLTIFFGAKFNPWIEG
jgi:hypothetical protein